MGQNNTALGIGPGFQGCIGDLTLFSVPLDGASVAKAWNGGSVSWCPEYAAMPAVTSICKDKTTVQVCFNICNNNPTAQSYHWSLAGLPAGPGCTVAGPTVFSPASGTVTVPPGNCSAPICVTITRPTGLTAQNATSCFQLTFFNDATGACRSRAGAIRADNTCWCATPVAQGIVSVPARVGLGTVIGIGIKNPCDPISTMAYRLSAVWLGTEHEDPLEASLNGLPPGEPVLGELRAGPGVEPQLPVMVSFPKGYDPSARYEIVLEADTDGDGVPERLCGTVVHPDYDLSGAVSTPPPAALVRSARLLASPNPFLAGSSIQFSLAASENVQLAICDVSGRLVKILAQGRLEAGQHRFTWDGLDSGGRRAKAGVYFARLTGGGGTLNTKLVKVR